MAIGNSRDQLHAQLEPKMIRKRDRRQKPHARQLEVQIDLLDNGDCVTNSDNISRIA